MKTLKSQAGIAHLALILVVVFFAVAGFAGYRVYTQQNKKPAQQAAQPAPTKTEETKKEEPKPTIPEGFVEYENKELGFKFAYPKDWGDITVKDTRFTKDDPGKRWQLTFSDKEATDVAMGLTSTDWTSTAGRGGSCHATGGPTKKFRSTAQDRAGYFVELLLDEKNLVVAKTASADYCANVGLFVEYYFEKSSSYEGVLLSYITKQGLTETELQEHKNNKYKYVPQTVEKQLLEVAKSFQQL